MRAISAPSPNPGTHQTPVERLQNCQCCSMVHSAVSNPEPPILAFFVFLVFFLFLAFLAFFLPFPSILGVPQREKPLLFWGFPLLSFQRSKGWRVREESSCRPNVATPGANPEVITQALAVLDALNQLPTARPAGRPSGPGIPAQRDTRLQQLREAQKCLKSLAMSTPLPLGHSLPVQRQTLRAGHVLEKIVQNLCAGHSRQVPGNLCERCAGASENVLRLCENCAGVPAQFAQSIGVGFRECACTNFAQIFRCNLNFSLRPSCTGKKCLNSTQRSAGNITRVSCNPTFAQKKKGPLWRFPAYFPVFQDEKGPKIIYTKPWFGYQ